jgi:RHS repeat-associated protein
MWEANEYDDHRHRRVQKITPSGVHTFLHDGWLPALEHFAPAQGSPAVTEYVWGGDLSGARQGAGGLLFLVRGGSVFIPCCDASGNITDYLDAGGTVAAHRGYDPFGNTAAATGPMADAFHFWFSTKYLDHETSLYYYGYRFYSPGTMRWLNRDLIGEDGRPNLYAIMRNDPVNNTDYLGLKLSLDGLPTTCGKCSVKWIDSSGVNGALSTTSWNVKTPPYEVEMCGGGTGASDRQKFKLKARAIDCKSTIQIDRDPKEKIGKGDQSISGHEMKHVDCYSVALEWALSEIASRVSGECCCSYDDGAKLVSLIIDAARYKASSCSYKVDAVDYVRHDNRAEGSLKGDRAAQLESAFRRKMVEVEELTGKWGKCK